MVKHVILYDLKEEIQDKEAAKQRIKENLEGLLGKVPGLLEMKIYTNPLASSNADLCLDSMLESKEALEGYKNHPDHVKVATEIVRPAVTNRRCMDCEI